jgi:nicotinate-nucleotide adenylyltransferase
MKIGLFFGSYNPVHIGHMIIAEHMVCNTDLDEVWMVVSPHNPLKKQSSLAGDYDRLHLVNLAIGDNPKIRASNVEFNLPRPSYTIDTLINLKERHPDKEFALIMGGDNLATLHKWKNYEILIRDYQIYVYQRPSYDLGEKAHLPNVIITEAPMLNLSATEIRKKIEAGKSVRYMLPDKVYEYIMSSHLYKSKPIT